MNLALDALPWLSMIGLILAAIVTAIVAVVAKQPLLGLVSVLPVAIWVLVLAFGANPVAPLSALWSFTALGFAILGVVAGSPLTVLVLNRTAPGDAVLGTHGGIIVDEKDAGTEGGKTAKSAVTATREVLRGGSTIGYLERVAIVGAIAVGHIEVLAAIIAIKGLGRYSELDSPAARERFIIGTLVSMIWASVCGALILFGGQGVITWAVG